MIARIALFVLTLAFWPGPLIASSPVAIGDVMYAARDYAFTGPDQITAGWITVTLTNQGEDLHQLQFIKLPVGKTAEDFTLEITANHKRLPSWVHRQGGPNSVIPGKQAVAAVYLDPGEYVVICGIPDRRGVPHVALGMLKTLRVMPSPLEKAEPPHSDVTITEKDFSFELSHQISAGLTTVRVLNKGSQAHEVVVVQLAPGSAVHTFIDAFQPGVPISPAGKPVGGMVGLEPEGEGFFTIDFAPGQYGLICFLPDLIRRAPHFTRGMLMDITVQ